VAALETVIAAYIAHNNDHPEPFVWTAHADAIIAAYKTLYAPVPHRRDSLGSLDWRRVSG